MYNFIGKLYKPVDITKDNLGIALGLKIKYKSYFGGKEYLLIFLTPKKEVLELKFELENTDIPIYIKKSKKQVVSSAKEKQILLLNQENLNRYYYSKVYKSKEVTLKTDVDVFINLMIEKLNLNFKDSNKIFFKDNIFLNIKYKLDITNEKDYFVVDISEEDNLKIISNSKICLLDNDLDNN